MISPPRRRVVAAPARRAPAELQSVRVLVEADEDADASYLLNDEARLEAYEREQFEIVCVRVEADVVIEGLPQTLVSVGCTGLESDLSEEEFERVTTQEWMALRNVLKQVGVPTEQLPLEADREWVEWRM